MLFNAHIRQLVCCDNMIYILTNVCDGNQLHKYLNVVYFYIYLIYVYSHGQLEGSKNPYSVKQ